MAVEGKAKYGPDAYGRGGMLIDTREPFDVKTELISTSAPDSKLWKMRTTLTGNRGQIMMEAECPDYLD